MRLSMLALLVSLAAGTEPAVLSARQTAAKVLTPEQTLAARQISDLRVSPDGARVAFVVTEPPKGAARNRDVWLATIATREVRQLTYAESPDSSPRWSPDGRALAFLSNRDGHTQIYLLRMDGGEGEPLTTGKTNVRSFEWAPDGRRIAFLATGAPSEAEEKKAKDRDDARVVDRDDKRTHVWMVDVGSKTVREVTRDPWDVADLAWEPERDRLIVVATDRPDSDDQTNRICRVTLADGSFSVLASPTGPFGQLSLSPDGNEVAYVGSRVDGPSAHDLYVQRIGDQTARNLTGANVDRPVGSIEWRPDGSIVGTVQEGFHSRFLTVTGGVPRTESADVDPSSVAVAREALLFVGADATKPAEIYVRQDGHDERLTHINDSWVHPPAVEPEVFRYRSFDGLEIEAGLLLPPGTGQNPHLPLVVLVHGGPTGRWSDSFEPWGQLLVARGYAVLYPNVRGSTGYGFHFTEMNRADWGGADFRDVMAGVDDLVGKGIADPDRLGIGGWSYGGYMAEWAITQTTRFKAAVSGAGLFNLVSEFGTEAGPSYDRWFFGLPYENPEPFVRCSPMTYVKNARTPTLILQGEDDVTDPIGQSQELYRALKYYGVPAELVLYPREGHGFREEKHLVDRLNRMIEWFDRYLKRATG